jgi:hypothetical protein
MVQAVVMIGKSGNYNDRRGRWLSLHRCKHSYFPSQMHLIIQAFPCVFIVFKIFSLPHLFLHCFMQYRADARKQEQQLQQQEESGSAQQKSATALVDQDQRKALKFGFSSKGGFSKVCN